MRQTQWSRIRRTKQHEQRTPGECWQWKANGGSVPKETIAVSVTTSISVQKRHSRILLQNLLRGRMREMHRELEVREAKVPVEECFDCRAIITSKELCTTPFCEKCHPPECLFYKSENGCRFGEKCSYAHRQVDEQPSKRSQKNGDKSAVAMLKITRQSGCVFQDMEPPKFSSILRKSSNILKPIQYVRFTKAFVRHADIRDQNPSLGMICPGDPHQRNPNAPKFEDRSASMHMISKKDLNSAELETVTTSRSPTTVITANGKVQTHDEATVMSRNWVYF